jgi:hypothetical protein
MGVAGAVTTVAAGREPSTRAASYVMATLLATVAGVYQGALASVPLNDDFMHVTYARQLLAGDWPGRDFFDSAVTLMYVLSAVAQSLVGYRLLAEAFVVGVATAVSAYLVFMLTRRLTQSTLAATLAVFLIIVAGPRGYSYPKVIVYAAAATLWWAYVWTPGIGRAAALGAWTAAAFYWRPDHGVYVAIGAMSAVFTAHGLRAVAVVRCAQAGAVTLALIVPFLVFMSATVGLSHYIGSGLTMFEAQHATMNTHAWPDWPIRRREDVIALDPAEAFAPVITVRWSATSSPDERSEIVKRYGLTPVGDEDDAQRVRLSERSLSTMSGLLNDPHVEDTAGVDRSTATVPWATWPPWERWRFRHWWLRFRAFNGVNEQTRAAEATAALLYAMPLLAVIAAIRWRRYRLPPHVTPGRLASFALFGAVTNIGLLRTPYDVRAVDGIVVPAILFGCCTAALIAAAKATSGPPRWLTAAASLAFVLLVMKSVAVAGQFGYRAAWLAGDWRSAERMRGAWTGVRDRLVAEPPLSYWQDRPAPAGIRLASYARECLPASERLLVLWFAPEIYYHAERLMASRHLVFIPGFAAADAEQRMALAKIVRYAPPLAFANSALDTATREIFPAVVDFVHDQYHVAAALEEDGERYLVLARRDERVIRSYGEQRWPCYR